MKEVLGKKHHELVTLANGLKAESNRNKIELGLVLLELKKFYYELEKEGIDYLGTFNQLLATLHLNNRRVFKLIINAEFVLKHKIPNKQYNLWDSSVLELLRLKKKKPAKYLSDIKAGISYSDLLKII